MVSDHLFDGGEIEWSLACKKAANNSRSVLRVSKSAKDHHLYRAVRRLLVCDHCPSLATASR
jgi:hypothetical protein